MLLFTLVACTSAQGQNKDASAAGDKAEIGGTMTLYTSQPEEDAKVLIDAFNERCPDVTVEVFRSGTEEVVSKVLAEDQAGSVLADVLLVADSVTFESLKEKDLLASYASPELAGIPADFVDKDNYYAGTKIITTGIIYNTSVIPAAPKAFADLTGPEYADQLIMPSPLYSGAAAYNVGVMSREKSLGWSFFEGLKANGMVVEKGNGAVKKAVVAGEKGCGIIVDYMAVRSKTEGAPVEFVYPAEGSPSITEPIGLLKAAKNEAAGKAFIDFVLSEEGQKLAADIGYTPIKEGVEAPEGLKNSTEIKPMTAAVDELLAQRDADKTAFGEIFQ